MNWLKTKMGSHGWDINDDDIKKPNVLFLTPIKFARQELEDFEEYFTVKIYDSDREEFIRRCKKGKYDNYAAILWAGGHSPVGNLDSELVSHIPTSISIISVPMAGFDTIDVDACTAKGITVTNTPGVVSAATADTAMFLILGCLRNFTQGQTNLRAGTWKKEVDYGHDMAAASIGIIGMGGVGKAIAKRANAFGMLVNYYNRTRLDIRVEAEYNAHFAAYETLLRESDVIVVCVPLNANTRHMINATQLNKMKKGVILINIARGPVVEEAALVEALESGRVGSAGLDVFEFEPKVHEVLLKHPRCTLLPHMGTSTEESLRSMEKLALKNIMNLLMQGEAITPINKVATKALEGVMTDSVDFSKISLTLQG
ncbi:D-isomer specific 2-hydroxyacid dehydrogenase [Linnemannia elongata]|uniref:Glyoxylate/hydroxypyruvate reductase n=1 Tax=Linnemannia elongata AG-77 TaxID=1314771 RepID=A0A197JE92_9FUNG|nr:D-isomer specific 2-hydroxyacid dehydrogenase [Linnemannia elongata]OAQ22816.1 glyoxylate/hydroxypyruvate reductase [Linnemannia elongata AG-77]